LVRRSVDELVGKTKILMSFVMPATFSGTPRISLISPARAAVINSYSIKVYDGAGSDTKKLDDAAPMFFLPLSISRVTPVYDHSTTRTKGSYRSPSLLLEFFGQSLGSGVDRRLLINGHHLDPQDPVDLDVDLNINEFRVVGNGLIQARIDRKLFFPHYTADYFEFDNHQNFTASINYADDGPAEFANCTSTVDVKTKTAQIQVAGNFFNLNYVPVSSTKDFTVTSTTLKSYDPMGRITILAQCVYLNNCGTSTPSYWGSTNTYDLMGNLTSYTDGSGEVFTQSLDGAGRPYKLTSNWVDSTHPATLFDATNGFYPAGVINKVALGNGLTKVAVQIKAASINL
jgi:YD repeat-containing protein